jgi:hypothetical protein
MNTTIRYVMTLMGLCLCAAGATAWAGDDNIRTLQNLERERARLLQVVMSPNMDSVRRADKVKWMSHRIIDLERMVIRDDRILGMNNPAVQRAFADYSMTFLSHASIEANLHIVDFWLDQQGISTDSVLGAKVGLR